MLKIKPFSALASFCVFCGILLVGCYTAADSFRNVTGLYTVSLRNTPYQSRVFEWPAKKTYDCLLALLQEQKLYIPIENRHALKIVAMGFERANDTTEVGFFLKGLTPKKTELFIASKNPNLLERISADIFSKLEKKLAQ